MKPISTFLDTVVANVSAFLAVQRQRTVHGDPERGSVTLEQVLWAVAMLGLAGVVITVLVNFVTAEAGKIA